MTTHHGGEVKWVRVDTGTTTGLRCVHVGPDRHDEVPEGAQCRCGWLNIGMAQPSATVRGGTVDDACG